MRSKTVLFKLLIVEFFFCLFFIPGRDILTGESGRTHGLQLTEQITGELIHQFSVSPKII